MKPKILLTSFDTWLPHHKSNSSDDLLAKIERLDYSHDVSLYLLRNLPVNIELASNQVKSVIEDIEPDVIICCGMAEKRDTLTIESNAFYDGKSLSTSVDLEKLTQQLWITKISHDAGKFVCEGLYYQILKYVQSHNKKCMQCIFVHVPLLETNRLAPILNDFQNIFSWFKSESMM